MKEKSAESRIVSRVNLYQASLAKLKGESFIPLSTKEYRKKYIKIHGVLFWQRAVSREKERMIAEKYLEKYRND